MAADGKTAKKRKTKRVRVRDDPTRSAARSPAAKARAQGVVCSRCHQHHVRRNGKPSCNGHVRKVRPYKPCPNAPIKGGAVCLYHGGATPQIAEPAKRRLAFAAVEGEVGRLLREVDLPEQHPIDGLLEVVRHSGAMVRLLGTLCAQLDLDPGEIKLSYNDKGDTKRYSTSEDAIYGYNNTGDQASHILVIMYGQWQDRYARACKLALDANIDERLVRNAENTTNAVYVAIQRAFEEVKMPQDMVEAFGLALAKNLRKLAGPLDDLQRKAIGA